MMINLSSCLMLVLHSANKIWINKITLFIESQIKPEIVSDFANK